MVFRARDTLEIAILAKSFQRLEEFIQRFVKLLAPRRKQITGEDLIPRFQSQKALVIFLRLLRIRCNPQCVEKLRETQSSPIPNFSRSSCGRTAKELLNVIKCLTNRNVAATATTRIAGSYNNEVNCNSHSVQEKCFIYSFCPQAVSFAPYNEQLKKRDFTPSYDVLLLCIKTLKD